MEILKVLVALVVCISILVLMQRGRHKSKTVKSTKTEFVVISTPLNAHSRECIVYDEGNGPYLIGPTRNVFYLLPCGNVSGVQGVNGDPLLWRDHIGTIVFKGNKED